MQLLLLLLMCQVATMTVAEIHHDPDSEEHNKFFYQKSDNIKIKHHTKITADSHLGIKEHRCHYIWDLFERGTEPGSFKEGTADLHDCTHVDLRESDISAQMFVSIAKALETNTKCHELNLNHNKRGGKKAGRALLAAMKINFALTELHLESCGIPIDLRDNVYKYLFQNQIKERRAAKVRKFYGLDSRHPDEL